MMTTEPTPNASGAPLHAAFGLLRGASARISRKRHREPAQPFLIIANACSGARWLATRLDALPDVNLAEAVSWSPNGGLESIADQLRESELGGRAAGAALVFNPTEPVERDAIEALLDAIDPETRVIHVTRGAFDVMASVSTFASETASAQGPDALAAFAEVRLTETPSAELAKTLLSALINDMACAKILQHVGGGNAMRVTYDSRVENFARTAAFLGSEAGQADIARVLESGLGAELRPAEKDLPAQFLLLKQLAAGLDAVRARVFSGAWEIDDVWRDGEPPLYLPRKLTALLPMLKMLDQPIPEPKPCFNTVLRAALES